jgi:hypothetical protein
MQQVGPRDAPGQGAGAQPGDGAQAQQVVLRKRGQSCADVLRRRRRGTRYQLLRLLRVFRHPISMRPARSDADRGRKIFFSRPPSRRRVHYRGKETTMTPSGDQVAPQFPDMVFPGFERDLAS